MKIKYIATFCLLFSGCASSHSLKEPQKTIIYEYFASQGFPITVAECFEEKFSSLSYDKNKLTDKVIKKLNKKASEFLETCEAEFVADGEQNIAWEDFLEELRNQQRSEIIF